MAPSFPKQVVYNSAEMCDLYFWNESVAINNEIKSMGSS